MKKVSQLLCVLWWCKTFRYFTRVQSCSLLLVFSFSLTAVCISRISCSDHPKLSFIFVRHVSNCVFHSSVSLLTPKSFCSYTFVFNFCISSNFVINSFFRFSISRLISSCQCFISFVFDFTYFDLAVCQFLHLCYSGHCIFWITQTVPYFLCWFILDLLSSYLHGKSRNVLIFSKLSTRIIRKSSWSIMYLLM